MTRTLSLLATFAAAFLFTVTTEAQKGKPPRNEPATIAFRCAFSTDPFDPCPGSGSIPDGIRADTSGLYNAIIDSVQEANLFLAPGGGRFLWLDFRNGPPPGPGDRRHFETLMIDNSIFHTNVVDSTGAEVSTGLRSLAVGQVSSSRLKITFNTINPSGVSIAWAVRFNPEGYPGSDHITVRRLSTTTWELEATADDRALLGSGGTRRDPGTREGPFSMPFKAIVTSPPGS